MLDKHPWNGFAKLLIANNHLFKFGERTRYDSVRLISISTDYEKLLDSNGHIGKKTKEGTPNTV